MSIAGAGGGDNSRWKISGADRFDGRLELVENDDRLPWLEGDDDYEPEKPDNSRLITVALAGLAVIVVLVGAFWWFTRSGGEGPKLAEGALIEAPQGPYKERPKDAGGREVAGTGDASYAVAEGKVPEGKLAANVPPAPKPVPTPTATASGVPVAKPSIDIAQKAEPVDMSGVGVQVGAYATKASAQTGWQTLMNQYPALQGAKHRILEGKADFGTVYRLQAVAGDRKSANALCEALKSQGGACQVK